MLAIASIAWYGFRGYYVGHKGESEIEGVIKAIEQRGAEERIRYNLQAYD